MWGLFQQSTWSTVAAFKNRGCYRLAGKHSVKPITHDVQLGDNAKFKKWFF